MDFCSTIPSRQCFSKWVAASPPGGTVRSGGKHTVVLLYRTCISTGMTNSLFCQHFVGVVVIVMTVGGP